MNGVSRELLRFAACAAIFSALGALWVLPEWVHTLDDGPPLSLKPSEVAARPAGTFRLALNGVAPLPAYVKSTKTFFMNGELSGHREALLLPVVDVDSEPGAPVPVLFDAFVEREMLDFTLPTGRGGPVDVVVRDALWEGGVDREVRELFRAEGVTLAPDVRVVTPRARNRDRLWAWGATGAAFFLGLIVAEQLRVGAARRRDAAGAPLPALES